MEALNAANEKFSAVPAYRSTSSTRRENPSQPFVSGAQEIVWLENGTCGFQVVELVKKEGRSEPRGASRTN